nr:hypothetical protein [Halomonas ilicicola]
MDQGSRCNLFVQCIFRVRHSQSSPDARSFQAKCDYVVRMLLQNGLQPGPQPLGLYRVVATVDQIDSSLQFAHHDCTEINAGLLFDQLFEKAQHACIGARSFTQLANDVDIEQLHQSRALGEISSSMPPQEADRS